jgi:hypothetical protein
MVSTDSTAGSGAPSFSPTTGQIADEVTSLIDEIDEILPDHAPGRIGHRQRELPGEMVDQRGLHRNEASRL